SVRSEGDGPVAHHAVAVRRAVSVPRGRTTARTRDAVCDGDAVYRRDGAHRRPVAPGPGPAVTIRAVAARSVTVRCVLARRGRPFARPAAPPLGLAVAWLFGHGNEHVRPVLGGKHLDLDTELLGRARGDLLQPHPPLGAGDLGPVGGVNHGVQ